MLRNHGEHTIEYYQFKTVELLRIFNELVPEERIDIRKALNDMTKMQVSDQLTYFHTVRTRVNKLIQNYKIID